MLAAYEAGLFHAGLAVMAVDATRCGVFSVRYQRVLFLPGFTLGPLLSAPWCRPLAQRLHHALEEPLSWEYRGAMELLCPNHC